MEYARQCARRHNIEIPAKGNKIYPSEKLFFDLIKQINKMKKEKDGDR